jgi:hypothetical protein
VDVDRPYLEAVLLTPAAAEETDHRLPDGAATAQGQRVLKAIAAGEPDGQEVEIAGTGAQP